jgi:hypothetical protein
LDLADFSGEVKNLQENYKNYANVFLKEREKYILVKVESKNIFVKTMKKLNLIKKLKIEIRSFK